MVTFKLLPERSEHSWTRTMLVPLPSWYSPSRLPSPKSPSSDGHQYLPTPLTARINVHLTHHTRSDRSRPHPRGLRLSEPAANHISHIKPMVVMWYPTLDSSIPILSIYNLHLSTTLSTILTITISTTPKRHKYVAPLYIPDQPNLKHTRKRHRRSLPRQYRLRLLHLL